MAISVVHITNAAPGDGPLSTSGTVTIPSTTAGNCLVVCVTSEQNTSSQPTVTGVTLGGSADNFSQAAAPTPVGGTDGGGQFWVGSWIWVDPDCAGGQTALVVNGSGLGLGSNTGGIVVYEISGLATSYPVDRTHAGSGTSSTWSSGATAATTQATEIAVGAVGTYNAHNAPSSPWNNRQASNYCLASYETLSSTGTVTYTSTQASSGAYAAAVITLATAPTAFAATGSAAAAVLAASGTALGGDTTSAGSAAAAVLAASGTGTQPVSSSGSAAPASLAASGTGSQPVSSSGSAALAAPAASGAGLGGDTTASGSAALAALAASGSGNIPVPVTSSGSAALAVLAASGTGLGGDTTAAGSAALAALAASGTGVAPPPVSSAGSAAAAALAASGSGSQPVSASGSAAAAVLAASGTALGGDTTTSGAAALAALAASGTGSQPISASGSTALAAAAASGSALGGDITASGSAAVAALAASGTESEDYAASGSAALAVLAASGTGSGGDTAVSGSAALAVLAASGTAVQGYTSTGSAALASLAASGSGGSNTTSSGSAALAVLAASGTAVNAPKVTTSGTAKLAAFQARGRQPAVFPYAPLGVMAELNLAGTWTDITDYLYQREGTSPPIVITRGRPDESGQANPSQCTFELDNRDGRFSPLNPSGAYYGNLNRNTPVRVSLPAQYSYLRLETDRTSYASCPDSTSLHITGNIDIRLDVLLTNWQESTLVSKWPITAGEQCWLLQLNADGTLELFWSTTGTDDKLATSTASLPVAGRQCIRVTLTTSTGAVEFYTGPAGGADTGPWTQLGSTVTGGSTSIYAGTAPLVAGNRPSGSIGTCGNLYELEVRSGIGGTVVAHPVFSAQSAGTTSFSDGSNTWTLSGTAEISGRDYRYHGEMSSLPARWDVTGADISVPVTAGGLLRRLGQGNAPTMSSMKRGTLLQAGNLYPVQYWPCEDGAATTGFGSVVGGPLLDVTSGTAEAASDSTFLASAPLPVINGSEWSVTVPSYTSHGALVVRFLLHLGSTIPTGSTALVTVHTSGTMAYMTMYASSATTIGMRGYNSAGTELFDSTAVAYPEIPVGWWSMELTASGSTVTWALTALTPGQTVANTETGTFTGSIGLCTSIAVDPAGGYTDTAIGHISLQSAWVSMASLSQQLNAWQGEDAGDRFARVCGENGLAARVIGAPDTTQAMGAQPIDTVLNILQECEDCDRGQIFEPRQVLALGYRTLNSMLSQDPAVAADYSQSQFGGTGGGTDSEIEPTYDDQFTRNDYVVSRSSGSVSGANYQYQLNDGSAMSISNPPTGVGDYADQLDVNVDDDSQLPAIAQWLVSVGTVNEARWPVVPFNLARKPVISTAVTPVTDEGTADGTFESGVSGWTATGGSIAQSSAHAHTGGHSALLTVSGSPTQAYFRPSSGNLVPVTPGGVYTCTLWVYGSNVASVSISVDWSDSGGTYLSTSGSSPLTATTTWTQITATVTAPADAAYAAYGPTITGSPSNGTTLYTDDVVFGPPSLYWALLAADIGDYVNLINMLSEIVSSTVKQIIYGANESLGGFHHTLSWNCVPESPYEADYPW